MTLYELFNQEFDVLLEGHDVRVHDYARNDATRIVSENSLAGLFAKFVDFAATEGLEWEVSLTHSTYGGKTWHELIVSSTWLNDAHKRQAEWDAYVAGFNKPSNIF